MFLSNILFYGSVGNGYAGLLNYQGGKFATELDAVQPIITEMNTRGIAFFEDGSLASLQARRRQHISELAYSVFQN